MSRRSTGGGWFRGSVTVRRGGGRRGVGGGGSREIRGSIAEFGGSGVKEGGRSEVVSGEGVNVHGSFFSRGDATNFLMYFSFCCWLLLVVVGFGGKIVMILFVFKNCPFSLFTNLINLNKPLSLHPSQFHPLNQKFEVEDQVQGEESENVLPWLFELFLFVGKRGRGSGLVGKTRRKVKKEVNCCFAQSKIEIDDGHAKNELYRDLFN